MTDYRQALLEGLPWINAPLVARCLEAVASFPDLHFREPLFGDGELPIPLPFFPLFEFQMETQYGIWISDPRSLAGVILIHYLDGQHSSYLGRTGVHLALELLESSRTWSDEEQPSLPLTKHLFPEASAHDVEALSTRIGDGCFDACRPLELGLSTWPLVAGYVSADDEIDPRGGESEGFGDCAWCGELAWRPVTDERRRRAGQRQERVLPPEPQARFQAALANGDLRSAWGALGSSGWQYEEAHAAWTSLASCVHPTLQGLVGLKLSALQSRDAC